MKRITVLETHMNFAEELLSRATTGMIIIHHVGGTDRDVAASEIHKWHLEKGWAGIGYHFVIRKAGTVERGRPKETVGSHCYGHNSRSIGINLVGDFQKAEPSTVQLEALGGLLADLCAEYGLDPSTSTIVGHRDKGATECPGDHLYNRLQSVREHAAMLIGIGRKS